MGETSGKPPERVQMNVRIPPEMREAIDARRGELGMTRDEWVANACELALRQPVGTPVRRPHVVRPATQRGSAPRAGYLNGQ